MVHKKQAQKSNLSELQINDLRKQVESLEHAYTILLRQYQHLGSDFTEIIDSFDKRLEHLERLGA